MKKTFIVALLAAMCVIVQAQTAIYRSVQPDPDNNNTTSAIFTSGGITLTISGTTATFSSGAPDTIGVGCAIQYDSSNAGAVNAICFISARTSETAFTVQRFNGGTPASCSGDTDWSVFHAYTKISNCTDGVENVGIAAGVRNFDTGHRNIVTTNEQWNIACYRGLDSTNSTSACDNFLTGASNYIRIYTPTASNEVGVTQRHPGKRVRASYQLVAHTNAGSVSTLTFNASATDNIRHVRIDGLFIKVSGTGAVTGIALRDMGDATADCRVTNCVIEGSDSVATTASTHVGIDCLSAAGVAASWRIGNTVIYNFKTAGATTHEGAVLFSSANGSIYCFNNTAYKCEQGYKHTTGFAYAKNCIANRSGADSYTGTWNAASTNNVTNSIDTPPGSNPRTGTVRFVSVAGNDFHILQTDTTAKDEGADLSAEANFAITTDIDGQARPQNVIYDIGADEFPIASGRRVWIVQSMMPEIEILFWIIAGCVAIGIYRHFFAERWKWEKYINTKPKP